MRGFLIALTFFTRLPLPAPQNVTDLEFKRSQHFYPLVGLTLGILLWLIGYASRLFLPPLPTGAILLAAEILLTGGIHLDGFMDSMDGLLSAREPTRMLEIMKDSRVGAHASISLAALLILKFSLLASLTLPGLKVLLVLPMLSRWTFLLGIIAFPYARKEGLGKGFHEASQWLVFLGEGLLVMTLSVFLLGYAGLVAGISALMFTLLFAGKISRLLGGLTGDLYGALIEISEVVALLAALPFFI